MTLIGDRVPLRESQMGDRVPLRNITGLQENHTRG